MDSFFYTSFLYDLAVGAINVSTDTFKIMLVSVDFPYFGFGSGSGSGSGSGFGSGITPSGEYIPAPGHSKRSDIYSEITGTGYSAGGKTITITPSINQTRNCLELAFSSVSWTSATFTASGAVVYKSRGGAASSDELVAFFEFSEPRVVDSGTFAMTFEEPMVILN